MDNFREVYKTHIGVSLVDSDDESVISNQSSLYENLKPIPYTDKEIESNTAIIVKPKEVDNFWEKRANTINIVNKETFKSDDFFTDFPDISQQYKAENMIKKIIKSKKQCQNIVSAIGAAPQKNQNGVAFCTICDVKIMTDEHYAAHFNAPPHKMVSRPLDCFDNLIFPGHSQIEGNMLSLPIELKALMFSNSCKLCNNHFNDGEHYQLPKHTENVELWLQNESSFSKVKIDATWPKELKDLVLPNACWLCDVKIASPSVVASHYGCKKHMTKIHEWLRSYTAPVKVEKSPSSVTLLENHISSDVKMHCYICDVDFKTDADHRQSLMHCQVSKLALSMVSQLGVPIWTSWIKQFKKVVSEQYCCLCRCQLTSTTVAHSHFEGKKHNAKIDSWIHSNSAPITKQTSSTEIDIKWLYCEVCQQVLDGTSFAEGHYKGKRHKERAQFFCFICKVANDDFKQYEQHNHLHQNQIKINQKLANGNKPRIPTKSSAEGEPFILYSNHNHVPNKLEQFDHSNQYTSNLMDTVQNESSTENINIEGNSSNVFIKSIENHASTNINVEKKSANNELQKEVLSELKKFVNLIYFSKRIPLEIALKYLKLYNSELASLKTIGTEVQSDLHLKENTNLKKQDASYNECHAVMECSKFESEIDLGKKTLDELKVTNLRCGECNQLFTESDMKCHSSKTGHFRYYQWSTNIEADNILNSEPIRDFKDKVTNLTREEVSSYQKLDKTEKESLDEKKEDDCIKQQKLIDSDELVLSFINNGLTTIDFSNDLEAEVVQELTDFIKTVYQCVDLPLDVVLSSLQRFNKELELFTEKPEYENGIELFKDSKFESKLEFIVEDSENVDKIEKYNVNGCEVIDENLPNKKKQMLCNITVKDSEAIDIVDMHFDSFNCHYYDYADENFEHYMNFREVYLYGSLNIGEII